MAQNCVNRVFERLVHNLYRREMARPRKFAEEDVIAAARDQFWSAGYERLVGHIRAMANATAAESRRGCLIAKSAAELGSTDKDVLARAKRSMQRYQSDLRAVIIEAQREGDIDPTADPDDLALLVLTFLRGSEALRKSGFSSARMQTVAEQLIALLPAQSPRYRHDTAE
jgi:TetR/AcrR family transcriptional regulator, transcriptional repressor for nem operon